MSYFSAWHIIIVLILDFECVSIVEHCQFFCVVSPFVHCVLSFKLGSVIKGYHLDGYSPAPAPLPF